MPARAGDAVRAAREGHWRNRLATLLLPPSCAACAEVLAVSSGDSGDPPTVCPRCLTRLSAPPHPRCPRCQAPRGTGLPSDRECNECRLWADALSFATSAAVLRPPADTLVRALKYGGWHRVARDLARRMVRALTEARVDGRGPDGLLASAPILVPVPTTPGRLRRRGYNQARLLAVEVCALLGGTLVDALHRPGGGRSQVGLRPEERWGNVEGAFAVDAGGMGSCFGKDVILVDDVLTTGATASAAATALVDAGARSAGVLTFARALPDVE